MGWGRRSGSAAGSGELTGPGSDSRWSPAQTAGTGTAACIFTSLIVNGELTSFIVNGELRSLIVFGELTSLIDFLELTSLILNGKLTSLIVEELKSCI